MTDRPTLTLAFLSYAPASAAQVLEQIAPEQAAAFLGEIPARIAAPAVSHMSAWAASRCLVLLTPDQAAAVLQNLAFHESAGLLRLIRVQHHAAILDALPARMARRLRGTLTYAANSVGAWIDPEIPSFSEEATVAEAVRFVADKAVASHVFLHLQESGRFAGAVPVTALMRSEAAHRLADLPIVHVRPVSHRATLSSAASLNEWDEFLVLPVAGRNYGLVGGLSRGALRKGLQEHRDAGEAIPGSITGYMLSALATTCAGLLHATADPEERYDA